ncbi:ES2 protein, putative [Plasmodium sp. gorilla clade G3]|nr:ES2 protein, putative [Plasmodium sp. gorilla clade G3]
MSDTSSINISRDEDIGYEDKKNKDYTINNNKNKKVKNKKCDHKKYDLANVNNNTSLSVVENKKNEKILIYENNDIVEYDSSYFFDEQKNNKHVVLQEEDYLSTLEYLIEKKFFPEMEKLRLKQNIYKSNSIRKNNIYDISDNKFNSDVESYHFSNNMENTSDHSKYIKTKKGSYGNNYNDEYIDSQSESSITYNKNEKIKSNNINNNNKNNMDLLKYFEQDENYSLATYPHSDQEYIKEKKKKKKKYKEVILPNGKEHKINLNISLSEFQKKYTSEDNKSFEYLLRNMKNKSIEKNFFSIDKRKKHNLKMDMIEEYTKKGLRHNIINTNKADEQDYAMMFSSNYKISNIESMKNDNPTIYYHNTRFNNEYNNDIKKQINRIDNIREQKILNKEKHRKEEQMIEQGKFNLLTNNNSYEYVNTPLIQAGKGVDQSPIITWGKIICTPKLIHGQKDDDDDKSIHNSNDLNYNSGHENIHDHGSIQKEFNFQKINNRELVAEKLQNSRKNIKYNKDILKKKNINFLINKNFTSHISSSSFKNSILSRYSQKRLSELAKKSSLASKILTKKKK